MSDSCGDSHPSGGNEQGDVKAAAGPKIAWSRYRRGQDCLSKDGRFRFYLASKDQGDRYYLFDHDVPVMNSETGRPEFSYMLNVKMAAEARLEQVE